MRWGRRSRLEIQRKRLIQCRGRPARTVLESRTPKKNNAEPCLETFCNSFLMQPYQPRWTQQDKRQQIIEVSPPWRSQNLKTQYRQIQHLRFLTRRLRSKNQSQFFPLGFLCRQRRIRQGLENIRKEHKQSVRNERNAESQNHFQEICALRDELKKITPKTQSSLFS